MKQKELFRLLEGIQEQGEETVKSEREIGRASCRERV